jgi:hypothetical protein
MKPMQMTDVFARLVEIAGSTNGGSRGEVVLSCDLLHQDALYRTQGALASLLADVANACGPVQARVLEQKFPFAFERRQEA